MRLIPVRCKSPPSQSLLDRDGKDGGDDTARCKTVSDNQPSTISHPHHLANTDTTIVIVETDCVEIVPVCILDCRREDNSASPESVQNQCIHARLAYEEA